MNASSLLTATSNILQVTLRTHQLAVLSRFYQQVIGLKVVSQNTEKAYLSANGYEPALLVIEEESTAPRQHPQQPGLFHVAYLVPNRLELARWFALKQQTGWPLQGLGDHLVSEAIYLADPDGNGIEIYADRPRETWPMQNGQIQMATDPVDVVSLLQELPESDKPWAGLPPKTHIGHIHLQVNNLTKAGEFYHTLLGFAIMQQSYPGALFLADAGYHHHIGLNTWRSRNAPPRNPNATGIASFLLKIPAAITMPEIKNRLLTGGFRLEPISENLLRTQDQDGIVVELTS